MKKLLSIVLVLMLVLSMSVVAFGVEEPEVPTYKDESEVTIKKDITFTTPGTEANPRTGNPAETFNFTVGAGSYEGTVANVTAPAIEDFAIDVAEDALTGSTNINLPTFSAVGVYTYPITETAGSTAGFDYDGETYYLVVTVINDGEGGYIRVLTLYEGEVGEAAKTNAFENEFSAGDLAINKQITGNYAVFTDEFEVTVILTPDAGKVIKEGPIEVAGAVGEEGTVVKNTDGTVTIEFKVTDDSEVVIKNIPYDVSYVITEDSGDYTSNVPEGGFTGNIDVPAQGVEITNNLDKEINTGINLDNLPYILILVGVGAGLVAFTMKRRFSSDK